METNGRPRKLDSTQENILRVSIYVSRITQVITQKEIATGYGISVPTLRRYYLSEERTLSQKVATASYDRRKAEGISRRGTCAFCTGRLKAHPRCEDCGVLIHQIKRDRNGGSPDMIRCNSCFDTQRRARIYAYGLA